MKIIIFTFPESKLILSSFHTLKNIKSKIPNLNQKKDNEKKLSKNLIVNIKLMFFIPEDKINSFYSLLKKKFIDKCYDKFFKYLNKFILGK